MKTLFPILFCLITFSLFSQNTIYPIKENGQWGFINDSGLVVLSPQYDAIKNQIPSKGIAKYSCFLVEKDKKFGIVDLKGIEILPPKYPKGLELLSNTPLLFKVKTKNKLLVVGKDGKEWKELEDFDDASSFNKEYLLVKKGEKWGIYKKGKGVIIPPNFESFQHFSYKNLKLGLFIFNKKNKKGVIDTLNNIIIPARFDTIINVSGQITSCKLENEPMQLYYKGDSLGIKCSFAVYFSDRLIRVHFENNNTGLFNINTFNWITPTNEYTYFRFLTKSQGYIKAEKGKKEGLIDSIGNVILAPKYAYIKTFNTSKEIFQYGSNKNWGIVQKGDSILQDSIFEFIGYIKEDKGALVLKNKKVGLLNVFGQLVLPVEYDEIEIKPNKIRAFKGRNLTEFTISDAGELSETRQLKNVFTIRAGYKDLLMQQSNTVLFPNSSSRNRTSNRRTILYKTNRNGLIVFSDQNLKGLKDATTGEIVLPAQYSDIIRANNTSFCILKKVFDKPQQLLSKIYETEIDKETLIFSETQRKIIHSTILGVRLSDYHLRQYAAFIREDGSFGLLAKDGSIKMDDKGQPFTASFINDLIGEKHLNRVYFGGNYKEMKWLTKTHPNEIGDLNSILVDFNVDFSNSVSGKTFLLQNGRWAYMDTLWELRTQPKFIMATQPYDGRMLCQTVDGMGLLDSNLDVLLPFEYKEIRRTQYFRTSYFELTKKNETPVFLSKKGEAIQTLGQYDKIMPFQGTLTAVRKDTLWGYINAQYEEIIPCQYRLVRPFSEGLAAVRTTEGWHYINETGEKVLSLNKNIRDVGQMQNGMAWFSVGSILGFSSIDNPVAIFPKFQKASNFDGEVAVIKEKAGFGIINRAGKYILKPSLRHIKAFNGNEVAAYKKADSRLWGLINKQGEFVTGTKFDLIGKFKNGYAKIKKGYSYGLIDSTGKIVIPIEYDELGDWNEGLITVRPRYGKWQYINLKNQVIIKGDFQKVEIFQNGKAIVNTVINRKNEMSVINKDGSFFFESIYNHNILHYQDGMVGIKKSVYSENFRRSNTIFYYKDSLGNEISDDFIEIFQFKDGLAIVKKQSGFGVIDEAGMYIIEAKYQQIVRLPNGIFKAINVNHKGLSLADGTMVIEPKYDFLKIKGRLMQVSKDARISYFRLDGDWIWK
jgi:hypothetical protein